MLQYSSQYYQDIEGEVIHIHHLATDINFAALALVVSLLDPIVDVVVYPVPSPIMIYPFLRPNALHSLAFFINISIWYTDKHNAGRLIHDILYYEAREYLKNI